MRRKEEEREERKGKRKSKEVGKKKEEEKNEGKRTFPGGPVDKTSPSVQGVWVWFVARAKSYMPHSQKKKKLEIIVYLIQ